MKMKHLMRLIRRLRIQGGVIKHIDGLEDNILAPRFALATIRQAGVKTRRVYPIAETAAGEILIAVELSTDSTGAVVFETKVHEGTVEVIDRVDFII